MENLKKKIIFEDRWTFKSFIRILESCQKQNSSLRRYEIIMELLSLLDPIWKIQKNKNHEKHDDGKNYARKFSEDTSTRPIPNNIKDKANDYYLNPPKLSDNFKEFIKKFNENQLLYFLEKIFVLEMEIENVLYSTELKQILDFIKENDLENIIIYSLLDTCAHRENKDAPNLTKDFFIADERLYSKKTRKIEILTKPPRLLVEQYKERGQNEWDTLDQKLRESNGKIYIQGLSGLGKTEFAKEFWYKSKENKTFKYFAWIEFTDDLESSFRSQFDPLGLKKSRPKVSRDELLKIVQNMGNELFIVIDNFYSGKDFLKDDFLSDLCALNCTILITTTEKLDYLGLKQHELSVLSLENCISLFKDYYSIESDDKKISSIAEMTGYHTILIELISKSCNEEEISLDEIIVFLSENNLKYSDIGISSFHPRLATDKSVSEQLTKLFSIMSNRLSKDELDLLIKFSIFKTIPFLIESVKELFELKSRDSLRRLVKLGWIKVENYLDDSNYPRNLYSIHVAPSLTVLNNNDISIYFDTLSSKIFRLLFLTSKDTDALLLMQNIAIPYLVGAFIETFSNIESSFEFIIIYKEYIYRLNKAVIPIETSIDLCEIYAECAKDMLSKMKQSDFEKFSQKTIYNQDIFMNTPYTCDNFKQRLRFEIDMLLASSISKEKSRSSLNRQEDILMNLLTNINLNDSFETQYNLLGVYGNLLVLYCKYQQKKKILPLIKAILSEIKLQPKRKKLNELSTLYFIYAIFICLLDISNGFRILEMYDNSSKYLNRAKRILFILKKSKDKLFDFNINYEEQVIAFTYAQGRLIYCQEFGMDSYKKEFLNECKKLIRSNDQNIKDRLEECMFEYDPFFNDHPNDNIFE